MQTFPGGTSVFFLERDKTMTMDEASEHYKIPVSVLKEYESWGLCGAVKKVIGDWQYDDQDLERLSLVMTLHDIGFSSEETETYMKLLISGKSSAQLRMLNQRRNVALDEIHFREKQLERMDYLRHEIKTANQGQTKE